MPMTLVSTTTVGSGGAASIEFTNIPQTGKEIICVWSARLTTSTDSLFVRLNNSSSGYTNRTLYGSGANTTSLSSGTTGFLAFNQAQGTDTVASVFSNGQITIANYTSTVDKFASVDGVYEDNTSTAFQIIAAGSHTSTAAITSLQLVPSSINFAQFTTASLYIVS